MAKSDGDEAAPTMIIPRGTRIQVDDHGQLSVTTPGNLVIQNSGAYALLESVSGSIRIEPHVQVEAVSIRCAETCYIEGSLTAWKVAARTIHLDETAQAHIVLQETEGLEIGRGARLVGNFTSEKELFMLFSRFADQLRSLPFTFERPKEVGELHAGEEEAAAPEDGDGGAGEAWEDAAEVQAGEGEELEEDSETLPENLFFSLVLLEREAEKKSYGPTSRRVIDELVKLLRGRDLETLRHTYRTLFARIVEPGEDLRRAQELVQHHFRR